jgi:hypothetical protein
MLLKEEFTFIYISWGKGARLHVEQDREIGELTVRMEQ